MLMKPKPARRNKPSGSVLVAVRVQREKVDGLDAIAKRKGITRSAVIQIAIAEKIEREPATSSK